MTNERMNSVSSPLWHGKALLPLFLGLFLVFGQSSFAQPVPGKANPVRTGPPAEFLNLEIREIKPVGQGPREAVILYDGRPYTVTPDRIINDQFRIVDILDDKIIIYSMKEQMRRTLPWKNAPAVSTKKAQGGLSQTSVPGGATQATHARQADQPLPPPDAGSSRRTQECDLAGWEQSGVVFEITCEGYGWGPSLHGHFIDRNGGIFSFANDDNYQKFCQTDATLSGASLSGTTPPEPENPAGSKEPSCVSEPRGQSQDFLRQKYGSNVKQVGTVDQKALEKMLSLVSQTCKGAPPDYIAADDAIFTDYFAILTDAKTGAIRKVFIATTLGDTEHLAKNEGAELLFPLLKKAVPQGN